MNTEAYRDLTTSFPNIQIHLELDEDTDTATIYVVNGDLMIPYTGTDPSMDTAVALACAQAWLALTPD
jgi:hypothetical protein